MKKKFLFASVLLFMVLTFVIPIEDKVNRNLSGLAKFLVNPGQYLVMSFTLMLTVFISNIPSLRNYIDKHIKQNVLYILIYLAEIITFVCFVLRVTEIWGTWSTFGLYVITILMMPILLERVIPKIDALLLGIGAVYAIIGLWEMPYQYGLWKYWELPQGETRVDIINQIVFLAPFVLLGGFVIAIIIVNNFKSFKFKWKLPAVFLTYTIVGFIARFNTNFWTDLYYNVKAGIWVYTQPNVGMMALYRSTKVSLVLCFLTIFVRSELEK